MVYLYEEFNVLRKNNNVSNVPAYIVENLNSAFEIRKYQRETFENFVTYFENENYRQYPAQVLFHMATGSGKTFIMAGLMIYLYK